MQQDPPHSTEPSPRRILNHALRSKLILAVLVLFFLGIWTTNKQDPVALIQVILDSLRTAGPILFFLAMTLTPAVGAPLSFFTLTAGAVFAPQMGMPLVILASLGAIAVNMALSYVLAHRILRPLVQRVVNHLGYKLPEVNSADATDITVFVRVTPGIPFPIQNYLLGLAGIPLGRYLYLSSLIVFPLNAAIIVMGEALLRARGRWALVAFLVLLAVIAAINLLRRRVASPASRSWKVRNDHRPPE